VRPWLQANNFAVRRLGKVGSGSDLKQAIAKSRVPIAKLSIVDSNHEVPENLHDLASRIDRFCSERMSVFISVFDLCRDNKWSDSSNDLNLFPRICVLDLRSRV
jgi:hypothetical protein